MIVNICISASTGTGTVGNQHHHALYFALQGARDCSEIEFVHMLLTSPEVASLLEADSRDRAASGKIMGGTKEQSSR
jgi:hypothetical protein